MSKNRRLAGIRWKLLLPGLGAVAVLLLLMQVAWVPWQVELTEAEIQKEQQRILSQISPALFEPLVSADFGQLYSTLDSILASEPDWRSLELRDVGGQRIYPLEAAAHPKAADLVVSHAIEYAGRPQGMLTLRYNADARLAEKAGQIQLVAIVVFAVFLSTLVVNFVLQDLLIRRPAQRLVDATNRLAMGDFDNPIPVQGEDEIGQLGAELEVMRTDLQSLTGRLRDQASHTQAVLDTMLDGLITIDERGHIDAFNPAAEKIFGYSADEVIGQNVKILMPSPHREKHDEYLSNYQATGVARIIGVGREVEGQRKDGSLFPMELSIAEVTRQGRSMYVGTVRDITERKRMDRMKSEFVSMVSHELRTPLTAISGSLGLIAGGRLGDLPDQITSMVDIAYKNAQRLSHLINDLLDIEKLSAGKMDFDMRQQPLSPLIDQAIESNQGYGVERQVNLAFIGDPAEVQVRVDGQRLMQVLSNLISNAVKYSPEGGTVEIAVEELHNVARVSVTDHGPGIPEEFRSRIFQKFAQADSSDTRQKGGTGLGLAITRELVERMGGRIGFNSVEGLGASFYFELPLIKSSNKDAGADVDARMPLDSGGPRVLVVEDEPDVAHLLGLMLSRAGYSVDIVTQGTEALKALKEARYAAMTLDLMLPDIGGLEIIRQVRGDPQTADLPIVVVSAKMEEGRLAINGDADGVDWLAKPFDETRLLAVLKRHTAGPGQPHVRVLHVEDEPDLQQVVRAMAGAQFHFDAVSTLAEARARVALQRYDVVILDVGLPDGSGWDLLPAIRERQPDARVVILSGTDTSVDQARKVEAVLLKSQVSSQQLLDAISSRVNSSLKENSHERVTTHSVRGR